MKCQGLLNIHGGIILLGRELRVVVNTNDPDYEHIYSIEAYDDPNEELLYFAPSANQSDGTVSLCAQLTSEK